MTREIFRGMNFLGRTKLLDKDPERSHEMKRGLKVRREIEIFVRFWKEV